MKFSKRFLFALFAILMLVVVGCSSNSSTEQDNDTDSDSTDNETNENDENSAGGELKVALPAQPSIIDPHVTTETVTSTSTKPVFETLVVTNEDRQPVPYLAEKIDVTDDNKTYTFHLRQGIKFHNGQEMTAEDVAASMNRWRVNATGAKVVIGDDEFTVVDDYTVELTLSKPSSLVPSLIATERLAAIMPKELVEEAGENPVSEIIGTGPFKFENWLQDQYIHLTKNEDYVPFDEPIDGLAGKREALVDDIYLYFVSDTSTRMAGLQTGEYDIDASIANQNLAQIQNAENLQEYIEPAGNLTLYFNKKDGVFADVNMRQAVSAALDIGEIMQAAYSEEDLYALSHSYIHENYPDWYSEAGQEFYNQNDPEKAKEWLEKAGYNGETIRFLTTRDYEEYYNAAVVIQEQLKNIDVEVELEVVDWATLLDRRSDPAQWELFISGFSVKPQPVGLLPLDKEYAGWTEDDKIEELKEVIQTASLEEAQAAWDELQAYAWGEYVPVVLLGFYNQVTGTNDKVEGYITDNGQPIFWNVKKLD
ncbi:ABC transporter substrate-binding protein [Ornithinibacillus sp. 4-3]|uniref:ABC transporter substrate-binding protein n=1 Tax=Ornithinibacillus sp. 4-3 TaxID=3231488 RepID=A0AB39HS43_9BACI